MVNWHCISTDEVIKKLKTDISKGLIHSQVKERLKTFGPNTITKDKNLNSLKIFFKQFTNLMTLILFVAFTLSLILNEYYNAIAIICILLLNTFLSFFIEYKAEKTIQELSKYTKMKVKAIREGKIENISADNLVIGDIILLSSGDIVPADCRIILSNDIGVSEAPLTGESITIDKKDTLLPLDTEIYNRVNMLYMGTYVVRGSGRVVVVATGKDTEFGKIAKLVIKTKKVKNPLELKIAKLTKFLTFCAVFIIIIVSLIGLFRGIKFEDLIIFSLSLAVAAIPEGLPLILTITLGLGAKRMLTKKALIKKLSSAETLGTINVICTDKTGTITEDTMNAEILYTPDLLEPVDVNIFKEYDTISMNNLHLSLINIANSVNIDREQQNPVDPTDSALFNFSKNLNILPIKKHKAVLFQPFDSIRRQTSAIYKWEDIKTYYALKIPLYKIFDKYKYIIFNKGSYENIIDNCDYILEGDIIKPINNFLIKIRQFHNNMSSEGYRIIALSFKLTNRIEDSTRNSNNNCIFLGLIGLEDKIKEGVKESLQQAYKAHIRTIMITGDHPLTASAIAKKIGLLNAEKYLTGADLNSLSKYDLVEQINSTNVFARILPEQKLMIVETLQKLKNIVAMTGDGINDAPALKKADVGVSMNIKGNAISKESADIVLLDDNYSTIVQAIGEGRTIFDNIKKFITFLLGCNLGELSVVFFASILFSPFPITALQILWINLVTDGLPAIALSQEKSEPDVMNRHPIPKNYSFINKPIIFNITWTAFTITIITLFFSIYLKEQNIVKLSTIIFTILTFTQLGAVMSIRSINFNLFKNFTANKILSTAIVISFLLQLTILYVPIFHKYFNITYLNVTELSLCFASFLVAYFFIEFKKLIYKILVYE
jgi:Ca2+-transporting ATPase